MKGIKLILACLLFTTFTITRCTTWQYLVKYEDDLWILYEEISNNTIRTTVYAYGCKIILTYPARVEPYENFTVYINITDPAWAKYIGIGSLWINGTINQLNKKPEEVYEFLYLYNTLCEIDFTYDIEAINLRDLNATKYVIAPPINGAIMIIYIKLTDVPWSKQLEYILSGREAPFLSVDIVGSAVSSTPMLGANSILDRIREYSMLESEYVELKDRYQSLLAKYTWLKGIYESLSHNYTSLITEYQRLERDYVKFKNEYTILQEEYQRVIQENIQLRNEVANLEDILQTLSSENKRLRSVNYILLALFLMSLISLATVLSTGRKYART